MLNPFWQCCGPIVLWPSNSALDSDEEINTLCYGGLLLPACCECAFCQGSAPGLESYYRLTLSSASFHTFKSESDATISDVVISARGLAEDPKALVGMIMERAASNPQTVLTVPSNNTPM